jgi:hypothetical protein
MKISARRFRELRNGEIIKSESRGALMIQKLFFLCARLARLLTVDTDFIRRS